MSALVSYQLEDGIAAITMDDGKANALSPQMQAEINAALDRAAADKAVVLLSGRPGKFSAGFDLGVLGGGGEPAAAMLNGGFLLAQRLLSWPRPVVMACTGHAIAMGCFLVLSGDYRIGIDGPYKIGANEVAIGLPMPHSAVEICRHRLAPAHFDRALNTAEFYTPADSIAAGFLDRVVPESALQQEARDTALRFAKLNMPAHQATKQRVRGRLLEALRAAIAADDAEFRGKR
jgi:enoyl-CoA hydratase